MKKTLWIAGGGIALLSFVLAVGVVIGLGSTRSRAELAVKEERALAVEADVAEYYIEMKGSDPIVKFRYKKSKTASRIQIEDVTPPAPIPLPEPGQLREKSNPAKLNDAGRAKQIIEQPIFTSAALPPAESVSIGEFRAFKEPKFEILETETPQPKARQTRVSVPPWPQ